jgi:pimeloyl-ACP methyl ester carboxylesterase
MGGEPGLFTSGCHFCLGGRPVPVLTINGYAHNYEEVGTGAPLVYLAATRFDSAKLWVSYMEQHAAGFRVMMPDPRGLAGSAHTREVRGQDWVDDLAGLLDALGLTKVHLAAETLGSRIATCFAAEHPDRVSTLILNGTIAYSATGGDSQRRAPLSPERRRDMEYHHGADWAAVNDFYLNLHSRPEFHEYFDLRKAAPRVTAPVLLMRGDIDDPVHPVIHSAELHALFPRSWLAIFPNTEFNALRGRPKESWELIRRFLAEAAQ